MKKQRILSAIQPSGRLHFGNYLGAVRQWLEFQKDYDALYCIVDLHAITVRQSPENLRKNVIDLTKLYLAMGLDPDRCTIFAQSHIPAHTEVAWILGTLAKVSELERMTQFKDKSQRHHSNINTGLMMYPILMAADILLYQANVVPVGDDQQQHVELTRTLGRRFNNIFEEVFTIPEVKLAKVGARIMALDDPMVKMSKSAESPNNYLLLLDSEKDIRSKISKAVTDSVGTIQSDPQRPGITNLLAIYHGITGIPVKELEEQYRGKGYAEFKKDLSDVVVDFLKPVQKKYHRLSDDDARKILDKGRKKAAKIANETRDRVFRAVGLL